jgi:GT2 family glycosyltransferase
MDDLSFLGRLTKCAYGIDIRRRVNVPEPKEKIAAVVVTCNRKVLLEECLDSLLAQSHPLDAVYIVDNHSSDGTHDHLLARELIASVADSQESVESARSVPVPGFPDRRLAIHYVRLPENTGGAGGFHEGMRRALDAGFGWLWLMDDDVLTAPDALAVLVEKKRSLEARSGEPVLLNSLVLARDQADGDRLAFPMQELSTDGDPKRGVYHWRLSEIRPMVEDGLYRWVCPFNGTFVPARITSRIGLPNPEFFIWGDEKDFLWRAARQFDVYTAVDSKVYHPPARDAGFDWRQYYNIRNMIVLNKHFRYTRLRNLKLIVVSLVRGLRHGRWGLRLVLRAICDGRAGRLGKRDDLSP